MKKTIYKCIRCERIIGVDINPISKEEDNINCNLECINCYQKIDWSK